MCTACPSGQTSTAGASVCVPDNNSTPAGNNVTGPVLSGTTGQPNAAATFTSVTTPGVTTDTSFTPDPTQPIGQQLGGPATYFVVATTAQFTPPLKLCVMSDLVPSGAAAPLSLYQFQNGAWVDVTVSTSPLCGVANTLGQFAVAPQTLPIQIEIVNTINLKSNGETQVRIFSSNGFSPAAALDQTTIRFGETGFENSLIQCEAQGNGDLMCHFTTQLLGFKEGDQKGILRAKTNTTPPLAVMGTDEVKLTGAK